MRVANRTKPKTDFGIEVRVFTATTGMNIGLLYTKDAEKMAHEAPMPFMQHAPQERNLEVVINCEGRDAGMQIIYPFSACLVYGL